MGDIIIEHYFFGVVMIVCWTIGCLGCVAVVPICFMLIISLILTGKPEIDIVIALGVAFGSCIVGCITVGIIAYILNWFTKISRMNEIYVSDSPTDFSCVHSRKESCNDFTHGNKFVP